jgi:NDP-sugar pyrophosphorylase family protein
MMFRHCEFAGVPDPFFNINTVEDKEKANRILSRAQDHALRSCLGSCLEPEYGKRLQHWKSWLD